MRILNKRPALFMAVALLIGTVIGGILWESTLLTTVSVSLFMLMGVFSYIKRFKMLALMCAVLAFGIGISAVNLCIFDESVQVDNTVVVARVCGVSKGDKSGYEYRVEDITMGDTELRFKGVFTSEEKLSEGNIVRLEGGIRTYSFSPFNSYSMARYTKRIRYKLEPKNVAVMSSGSATLAERTKSAIVNRIEKNMGDEGGIAIAVLLGERSYMSEDSYSEIKTTGIAHIFAVSGLHIMTIAGAIYSLLRLLKVGRRASHIGVLGVVIFYGALAGFTSSVLRAVIMIGVSILAELTDRPPDLLSRLSLAVILSVLIRPLSVFETSFQMSYGAVAGIALLAAPLGKLVKDKVRGRMGGKIAFACAYTTTVNLFMLPMTLSLFGVVGLYSIPANILLVPLVSVAYIALGAALLFNLIFPGLGFLTKLAGYPFILFGKISAWVSSLPSAEISYSLAVPAAILITIAMMLLSPVFKLKKVPRICLSGGTFVAGILLAILL